MKVSVPFIDEKVKKITIVASKDYALTCKAMLEKLGATIEKEHTPETETASHVFVVRDLKIGDMHIFDQRNGDTCYIHYCELTEGEFEMHIYTSDISHSEKHVSSITVYKNYKKGNEDKSHKIADVYERRDIGKSSPDYYTVNWGAWGSVELDVVRDFSKGLKIALILAEDCTAQFVKN